MLAHNTEKGELMKRISSLERSIEQAELEKRALRSESASASEEMAALLIALEAEKNRVEAHTREIVRLVKVNDEGKSDSDKLIALSF